VRKKISAATSYSLGATLFHAVSGRPTFERETHSAAELKKLKSNPIRLKTVAPDVSRETAAVIDQMLRPSRGRSSAFLPGTDRATGGRARNRVGTRGGIARPLELAAADRGVVRRTLAPVFSGLRRRFRASPFSTEGKKETKVAESNATSAVVNQVQLDTARRELQARHYATAESLFRETGSDPAEGSTGGRSLRCAQSLGTRAVRSGRLPSSNDSLGWSRLLGSAGSDA
jgi:hypothetical protein